VTKDGATVTPSGGVTLTIDADGATGFHRLAIATATDPATFSAGSDFKVRLPAGATVGGASVAHILVAEFSLQNRALPAVPAGWLTAAGIAAAALNGKGDWNTVVPPAADAVAGAVDATLSLSHGAGAWTTGLVIDAGTVGSASNVLAPFTITATGLGGISGQYRGKRLYLTFADGSHLVTDACSAHAVAAGTHTFTFSNPQNRAPDAGDVLAVLGS
jgi:hypothetical protein